MKRKLSNEVENNSDQKKISLKYFKLIEPSNGVWQCQCGIKRKQGAKSGYTNLMSHITSSHKNYEQLLSSDQLKLDEYFFVSDKAKQIYGWIDWIVTDRFVSFEH